MNRIAFNFIERGANDENKNSIIVITFCFLTICTLACSYFTEPSLLPIIPDNSRGVTTFTINPSRRLVIVKPTPSDPQTTMAYEGKTIDDKFLSKIICGEPPPDVSDNIASALSAALSAKGEVVEKGSAEFAANIAKSLNTTAVLLFKRSQGLQLYKDGMYNLCLAAMNGQIKTEDYNTAADVLLNQAVKLIEKEIPYTQATAAEVSAQNAATSATEAKKASVDAEQSSDAAEAAAKKAAGGKDTSGGGTGAGAKPEVKPN